MFDCVEEDSCVAAAEVEKGFPGLEGGKGEKSGGDGLGGACVVR